MIYLVCGALAALSGVLLYAVMLAAGRADERAEREWRRRQEMELLQLDWRARADELRRRHGG